MKSAMIGNRFCDLFAETGVVTDLVFNNFNEFYINDVLYQIKLFIKHFVKENYDSLKYLYKFR